MQLKGEKMSMISKLRSDIRVIGVATGLACFGLGAGATKIVSAIQESRTQAALVETLEGVEQQGVKTCEEISGRLATTSPDLAVSCRIGYNKAIANARQALKAW